MSEQPPGAEPDDVPEQMRVRLDKRARLLEEGGHIGYAVRPTRRRQGHATRAIRLALVEARSLGIDRALVTCDHDNLPSRLTIENAGGVFEDQRGAKRRYWFDLPDRPVSRPGRPRPRRSPPAR